MGKHVFKVGLLLLMMVFVFSLALPVLASPGMTEVVDNPLVVDAPAYTVLSVASAFVQVDQPVDAVDPAAPDVPEYTHFLANMLALLNDLTAVPALAAGVLIFTNAIKAILALFKVKVEDTRAVLLALGVQVVVWIIYQFSVRGGFDVAFQQWYDAAATVINTLLPLVLTLFAAPYAYDRMRDNPVLGYGGYRPPEVDAPAG